MRISDVVKQIRAVLPNYTDLFGDAIGITSITASGNIATVTTTTAHGLSSGNAVTVAGVETRTPISSASQDGINFVFETGLDHDLTLGWPEHENIELGGFTDANWNTAFALKAVDNRRTFKVMSANTAPTLNGGEYLLEKDRVDGVNGAYSTTVTGANTFTVSGEFNDGTYTPVNGSVNLNPRVAVVIDIDRALEEYTKQGVDDYWLFVEPMDAEVSKDRDTYSDATATIANGQDMRTRIIDGFVCYVVAPVTNQIAGEASLDVCRHDLLLPMMRTLYGTKFDTGLTNAADFRTILNGHGVAAYNKAYLVYRYEFQVTMDLTDDDTVLPTETRAFRDINYSLDVGRTTT
tara:strand:- start:291 stop:1337 length:1047 start_codon:yes stop_codon:yes gene_type:complete